MFFHFFLNAGDEEGLATLKPVAEGAKVAKAAARPREADAPPAR
jgi:hypothetical protein